MASVSHQPYSGLSSEQDLKPANIESRFPLSEHHYGLNELLTHIQPARIFHWRGAATERPCSYHIPQNIRFKAFFMASAFSLTSASAAPVTLSDTPDSSVVIIR